MHTPTHTLWPLTNPPPFTGLDFHICVAHGNSCAVGEGCPGGAPLITIRSQTGLKVAVEKCSLPNPEGGGGGQLISRVHGFCGFV